MEILRNTPDSPTSQTQSLTNLSAYGNIPTSAGGTADSFLVTALRPAIKNEHRVNVYLNNQFAFSLDITQVVDFHLKVGQSLSHAAVTELRQASNFGKLYQRTLEWVLTRPRSLQETRDYLRRKQRQKPEYAIRNTDIATVIRRLQTKGYLDDLRFAEYYIENRFVNKGISLKRLRLELIKKGVAPDIIQQALQHIPRDERAELQKLITKKRRLAKYQDQQKLAQYLIRQGFSYDLVTEALAQL